MISLLLTLFISLFSICPSVDGLEDKYEDNVIETTHLVEKRAFTNQQYLYLTAYDLTNPSNIVATLEQLGTMEQLPTSSGYISGSTFVNEGGTILFNTSSFLNGISRYRYDSSSQSLVSDNIALSKIEFTNTINSSNSNISFSITFTSNSNYKFIYVARQFSSTFGGVLQTSWSSSAYMVFPNNTIDTILSYVWLFNQNITYDYWRIGVDDYNSGYVNGYSIGFEDGRMDTQATYDEQVYDEGYQDGYAEGIQYATDTGSTASTIFNGIFDVGLLPVNVFLTIFNFEVFGINIAGIVSALLTLSVVIIIVRFLIGGKNDDK